MQTTKTGKITGQNDATSISLRIPTIGGAFSLVGEGFRSSAAGVPEGGMVKSATEKLICPSQAAQVSSLIKVSGSSYYLAWPWILAQSCLQYPYQGYLSNRRCDSKHCPQSNDDPHHL